jgi:hypothetical protein
MGFVEFGHVSHDEVLFIVLDVAPAGGEVHFALEFGEGEDLYENGFGLANEWGHEHFDEDGVLFGIFGLQSDFLYFLKGELIGPDVALELILDLNWEKLGSGKDM